MTTRPLKLYYSPRSPFVRKVTIVLYETGLLNEVELVSETVALHLQPNPAVMAQNPLGKIPVLVLEDGESLFDSRVICEFLDHRADTGLFPQDLDLRIKHLQWQALGDGLTDILLLWRTELTRPNGPWPDVTNSWLEKVQQIMARIEGDALRLADTPFGIGQIAIICALGQLDFRWPDCAWRAYFPLLADCAKSWSERSSISLTVLPKDTANDAGQVTKGQLLFTDKSKNQLN